VDQYGYRLYLLATNFVLAAISWHKSNKKTVFFFKRKRLYRM